MNASLSLLHGALIHAAPGNNFGATVERRQVAGDEARMILAVQSAYATPLLESIKSEFLNAEQFDEAMVDKLASLASPPFAEGGAVLVTFGTSAFVGLAGNGQCGCEQASTMHVVEQGKHSLKAGQRWLVSTGSALDVTGAFFDPNAPESTTAFSNSTLDDALARALFNHTSPIATATTWVAVTGDV